MVILCWVLMLYACDGFGVYFLKCLQLIGFTLGVYCANCLCLVFGYSLVVLLVVGFVSC